MGQKHYRRVHIEGETWTYLVGQKYLSVRSPNGIRKTFPLTEVLDMRDTKPEDFVHTHDIPPATIKAKITAWRGEFSQA